MQQFILNVKQGDRRAEKQLQKMMKDGWRVVSVTPIDNGRSLTKTVGLGLLFLPLAFFGKRKPTTQYILEK
ncbi:MAG TPA: hypothetical protein DD730_03360 [Desulfosporosinus sp.]|nr:hypothetical protein [Desulfosporosinus sp.]